MDDHPVGLFDMDGTLCDYIGQLRVDMEALMAPGEGPYDNLYDETKPWLKVRMDLIKRQPGWWRSLPRLQLGWDVFDRALGLGFEIEILTKGPRSKSHAWAEKVEWIDRHFGPEMTINIVGKDKGHYYGRFLCDDYPPYVEGWLKHRPRGLGILIDNPSNRDFTHPNMIRYDGENLYEVSQHLEAVLKRKSGEHWRDYL